MNVLDFKPSKKMLEELKRTQYKGPWVVTYRVDTENGFTIFEAYRGDKKECQRIAEHSMAPNTFEDKKVIAFHPIVGPANEWDEFLAEN